VFVLNGYGLFMVSVPSIHHEAIAMSMLFLLGALTLLFWSMRRARPPGVVEALAMAGLLGGALASRVSAFGACGIIGLVFLHDALLDMETGRRKLTPGVIVFTVAGLAAVGGILAYNYLRFGAALEFGAQYQESIYAEYYRAGLFMRYEHLPFNIWSYFFRLPAQVDQFPYLAAPFFMIKTQSVGFPPFTVMYGNELACAMFLVFPLAAAWCLPLFPSVSSLEGSPRAAYFIVLACCASQILTVSLANISAARFYYDFFPLVLLTCYLGVSSLKPAPAVSRRVRILALVSVGISAAIYINGFQYYAEAIQYSR
jgi:hypothetical protein